MMPRWPRCRIWSTATLGSYRDVQTYLKERIREVLTGSSHPIVIRIYGEDLDVLRAKAAEVNDRLTEIPGLADQHVEFVVDIPQVQIEVDLAKAQQYGLKPGDVRRAAAYLMAGEEAGDLHTANRTYDVNVWSLPENHDSLTDIQNLLIDTPSGEQVRMLDVADVRIVPTPNTINRERMARRINVEAEVEGRDLGSAVADVKRALQQIEFPQGYHPELIGEYAERQAAQQRILLAGLAAMFVIYGLLRVSLGSWRLATMSFLSLPVALVGGMLAALLANNGVLSLGSLVGFLTILGVAARNGIMLISHYQHLEEFEGVPFGRELVLPRRPRARCSHHDDGAHSRAGAGTAGYRREHPRPRDRASDGHCDSRRPDHVDLGQSIHRPCTVLGVWQAESAVPAQR